MMTFEHYAAISRGWWAPTTSGPTTCAWRRMPSPERQPRLVVQPETTAQAADIIALAGRERFAVVPWDRAPRCTWGRRQSAMIWPCRWQS